MQTGSLHWTDLTTLLINLTFVPPTAHCSATPPPPPPHQPIAHTETSHTHSIILFAVVIQPYNPKRP
jgi:hypothetical protein